MIYVDSLFEGTFAGIPAKRCHLLADTAPELHDAAIRLGVDIRLFRILTNVPHYTISAGQRAAALRLGAVELSEEQIAQRIREARAVPA